LHTGTTVIRHIYGTHFDGARRVVDMRGQVNTYFFRESGVPDRHGRVIY
jgi:alpha-glucuronidase